jgi:hypothetical protein
MTHSAGPRAFRLTARFLQELGEAVASGCAPASCSLSPRPIDARRVLPTGCLSRDNIRYEPLTPSSIGIGVGFRLSARAIFGAKQIEGTNGILKN